MGFFIDQNHGFFSVRNRSVCSFNTLQMVTLLGTGIALGAYLGDTKGVYIGGGIGISTNCCLEMFKICCCRGDGNDVENYSINHQLLPS